MRRFLQLSALALAGLAALATSEVGGPLVTVSFDLATRDVAVYSVRLARPRPQSGSATLGLRGEVGRFLENETPDGGAPEAATEPAWIVIAQSPTLPTAEGIRQARALSTEISRILDEPIEIPGLGRILAANQATRAGTFVDLPRDGSPVLLVFVRRGQEQVLVQGTLRLLTGDGEQPAFPDLLAEDRTEELEGQL